MITRKSLRKISPVAKMFTNQEAFPKSPIIAINTNITRCYKNSKGRYYHTEYLLAFCLSFCLSLQFNIFGKQLFVISHNNKLKEIQTPGTVADDRSTPTLSDLLYPVISQEALGHRRRDHGTRFLRPIRRSVYTQENEHMSRK